MPTATPSYYPMPPEPSERLAKQKKCKVENQARTTFYRSKSRRLAARLRGDRSVTLELMLIHLMPFGLLILGPPLSLGRFMPRGSQKLSPRSN